MSHGFCSGEPNPQFACPQNTVCIEAVGANKPLTALQGSATFCTQLPVIPVGIEKIVHIVDGEGNLLGAVEIDRIGGEGTPAAALPIEDDPILGLGHACVREGGREEQHELTAG